MKVQIVILNWNGKEYLDALFSSLDKQTYKDFGVIFVDNASIDNSVQFAKSKFNSINILQLDKNYGITKGYNFGLEEALKYKDAEYIVLLNNDVILDENWLFELVQAFEFDVHLGCVASKIIQMNGENKSETKLSAYIRKLQYPPIVAGPSFMLRRKVLDEIGFYDETFFACYEDVELTWRAYNHGWKSKEIEKSIAYHVGKGTINKLDEESIQQMHFYYTKNWITTVYRHATIPQKIAFLCVFFSKICFNSMRTILNLKRLKTEIQNKTYIKAAKEFCRGK